MSTKDNKAMPHRPHIRERIIVLEGVIPEEQFIRQLPEWQEFFLSNFPDGVHTQKNEWNIVVKNEEDSFPSVPTIDEDKTSLSYLHRYWSSDPKTTHADWCVQLRKNSLIVNQRIGTVKDTRNFGDLLAFFNKIFPYWEKTFAPTAINDVRVEYSNMINKDTLSPTFIPKNDYIEVKDIFTVFSCLPMPKHSEKYIAPHECKHRWQLQYEDQPYFMEINTRTLPIKPFSIQVQLLVGYQSRKNLNLENLNKHINRCHDLALEGFDVYFTEEFKKLSEGMS